MYRSARQSLRVSYAVLLSCAATGCVDLDVQNPNAPDGGRALTAENVEALIADAYEGWLRTTDYGSPSCLLSIAAGEFNTPWSCCGGEYYARIPRQPTQNAAGSPYTSHLISVWYRSYEVIASLRIGLQRIEDGTLDFGTDGNLRARAFGKFVQGLAHGTLALLYDSAFVSDETMELESVTLQGYPEVMDAALEYLDGAIALAESGTFTIPAAWMSQEVSSTTLAQLAHSWRARFRANVARTPAERRAVAWEAVVADVGAGIGEDWELVSQCYGDDHGFCEEALYFFMQLTWQMQDNWLMGMADVSGAYQAWTHTPVSEKQPFLIVTPDTRWPQGSDETTQLDTPGDYYVVNSGWSRLWNRPDRGTWRWSYYDQPREPYYSFSVNGRGDLPQITLREMKALVAEAAYYGGDFAAVARFVNDTRTQHGLRATDPAGTNADCVPRLSSGACGDLWEMFKWEKRLETQFAGPLRAGWYFDSRGWGDLIEGTVLQFPVPYSEMELLIRPPYDYGGVGGEWGAAPDSYGFLTHNSDVARVVVTPTASTIRVGETVALTAIAVDASGSPLSGKAFTWSSYHMGVAMVDTAGVVTGVGGGEATIRALTEWGVGSATVTVLDAPQVETVIVTPDTVTLTTLGETVQFTATALDTVGTVIPDATFWWASSDQSVTTIDAFGLATAMGDGIATITATAGNASGSALVTVRIPPVVVVTPEAVSVEGVGATSTFGATAWDANGQIPAPVITWSSLNPTVAAIDDGGTVTALASGQVTIAAEVNGGVGYALVTVSVPGLSPVTTWHHDTVSDRSLYAVWGASASDVMVAGWWSPILHYDGTSWSSMIGWDATLSAVWGTGSGNVFAVGAIGEGILHYDGDQWARMATPSHGLSGVWGASPADVLAVGDYGLTTHFDGKAWHRLTQPTSDNRDSLDDVWGTSRTNVFAVGYDGVILQYDGSAWSAMASGTAADLRSVWGTSPDDVFAVGADGTILHYDGSLWHAMTSGTAAYLLGVWGTSPEDVYAVGTGGTILHYDGTSWSPMASGTVEDLHGVWCTSPGRVYVVGDHGTVLRGER